MEFKHTSILLKECIEGLNIKRDGIYVDGTLGGGGHSLEIAKKLSSKGRLIAIDKDGDAIKASNVRLREHLDKVTFIKDDFKNLKQILKDLKIQKVDGILLDLGISSYQIDNALRGFSYMQEAKLDMRMDAEQSLSAYEVVNFYEPPRLSNILFSYGEEKYASQIVRKIVASREKKPIETTLELVEIIKSALPPKAKYKGSHPAKKTFQAIRIEVNSELKDLDKTLDVMIECLNLEGRIAVITFHSLEDRIVKQTFKKQATDCICPPELPICVCNNKANLKICTKKPILPQDKELKENSRAASAKLRIGKKIS